MKLTRVSIYTNIVRTLELPCTQAQIDAWSEGALIQRAMPDLDACQREFIRTGSWNAEFDRAFDYAPHEPNDCLPITFFKVLNTEEAKEFRDSAKANYTAGEEILGLWHPAYRYACHKINMEAGLYASTEEE
jgi:hypothetical protein